MEFWRTNILRAWLRGGYYRDAIQDSPGRLNELAVVTFRLLTSSFLYVYRQTQVPHGETILVIFDSRLETILKREHMPVIQLYPSTRVPKNWELA